MQIRRIHPLVLAQFLLMAGCAQPVWERPETDSAAIRQDLELCTQLARQQSTSQPGEPVAMPKSTIHVLGMEIVLSRSSELSEGARQEHVTNSCMHGKGYSLVPAKRDDMR